MDIYKDVEKIEKKKFLTERENLRSIYACLYIWQEVAVKRQQGTFLPGLRYLGAKGRSMLVRPARVAPASKNFT